MATSRNSNKHIAAREVRATPSAVAQAMLASSQDRGVVENSTSPVQNGYQDKSSVAEKSGRRPESALETNGNKTVSEEMGFRDGSMASVLLIEDDKETRSGPSSAIAVMSLTGPQTALKGLIRRVRVEQKW